MLLIAAKNNFFCKEALGAVIHSVSQRAWLPLSAVIVRPPSLITLFNLIRCVISECNAFAMKQHFCCGNGARKPTCYPRPASTAHMRNNAELIVVPWLRAPLLDRCPGIGGKSGTPSARRFISIAPAWRLWSALEFNSGVPALNLFS